MPFTPHRNATPYALTNIALGAINATALNGIANAMQHLSDIGKLPVTVSGARVNGRVIPALGYAYPDSGQIRLQRKSINIPVEIPPNFNRFCLFFGYRLNPAPMPIPPYASGATLQIDLVKAGAAYPIASATWETLTISPPDYYVGQQLIVGKLPVELALSPVDTEQLYLRVYLDMTGGQDTLLDAHVNPFPNMPDFWNGLGSLSFAVFRDCGGC